MSDQELRRSIREGARRQLGTFGVPSYISIGDPYKDSSEKSPGGRWTRPRDSPGAMLRPAQHEEDAPRAPPFMTGAEISRFDNSVGTARYRSQIESECKANARTPRSDRAPPWALHDPTAYDDPTAASMAAMAAAPSSAASAPPPTAPLSKAQPIGTSGVHTLAYSYAQPPVGYLQPQQPVGAPYMMMQPPPLLLLPAMPAGAQPGVARRGQPQQPLTWQQQPPLASFPGYPGPMYVLAQPGVGPMGAPIPYGYAYGRQC